MTLSPDFVPSTRAELLSSTSPVALAAQSVRDNFAALNIPENTKLTPQQLAVLQEHFLANNNRAPVEMAA